MKIDVTQTLLALNGEKLRGDDGQPVTLRSVCINALMTTLEADGNLTGEDKLAAYTLAKQIQDEDQPDLRVEDLTKLKERIGKCYSPAVVGPVYAVLDGNTPA